LRWSARSGRRDPPRQRRTLLAFAAVTTLFFAWGFITSNNDPLIVTLRAAFSLNYTEALLTQIVFFLANGLAVASGRLAVQPHRRGRHHPRVAGADGVGLPGGRCSTDASAFVPILAALFVLAAGFTGLQVAANPLAAELGPPQRSHFRLNFAQAFNSLGVVLGVHFGSLVMLGDLSRERAPLAGRSQARAGILGASTAHS
jgi:FHS family L-fucose permease-like MFS transporter